MLADILQSHKLCAIIIKLEGEWYPF